MNHPARVETVVSVTSAGKDFLVGGADRHAKGTSAVACSVCPGFSWASLAAASFLSSSYTSGKCFSAACGSIDPYIGLTTSLLLSAVGTGLAMALSRTLPLRIEHASHLLVPASLSTVLTGFLILTTRREALTQVVGYLVLENGIFIFGLLLVDAMPLIVEVGVLLDLFVGVFVMGIVIHHVNRQFSASTSEHLSTLKE